MFTMTKVNSSYSWKKNKVLSNKEIKIIVNFQKYALKKKQAVSNWNKNLRQTAIWNAHKQYKNWDSYMRNTAKSS